MKEMKCVKGRSARAVVIGVCCVLVGTAQVVRAEASAKGEVVVMATGGTSPGRARTKAP